MKQNLAIALTILAMASIVSGTAPTIGTVSAPTTITLTAGNTTTITCGATITDTDGFGNITNVNATLFDNNEAGATSADDNNNHYTVASCDLGSGEGNTTNAVCEFTLQYYTNAGSAWECNITATNGTDSGSGTTGQTLTVQELKALSVTSLAYDNGAGGTIALGATSDQETMTITNTGNTNITTQVNGGATAMACAIGSIPLGNERYNTTSGFSYGNGVLLTDTAATVPGFLVPQRTNDGVASTDVIYWLLGMPVNGVNGTCTGTITVTAN
jgi:hypothetical protein